MTDVARPPRDTSDHGGISDLHDAWRILAGGTVKAARALVEIASDTEAPAAARVAASTQVLKMTGFGGPEVLMVPVVPREFDKAAPLSDKTVSAKQIIEDRMALLRAPAVIPDEDGVIDAVLVEES